MSALHSETTTGVSPDSTIYASPDNTTDSISEGPTFARNWPEFPLSPSMNSQPIASIFHSSRSSSSNRSDDSDSNAGTGQPQVKPTSSADAVPASVSGIERNKKHRLVNDPKLNTSPLSHTDTPAGEFAKDLQGMIAAWKDLGHEEILHRLEKYAADMGRMVDRVSSENITLKEQLVCADVRNRKLEIKLEGERGANGELNVMLEKGREKNRELQMKLEGEIKRMNELQLMLEEETQHMSELKRKLFGLLIDYTPEESEGGGVKELKKRVMTVLIF